MSCRYRAYFGYMSIASVIYSYFIQALSRLFFSIFHTNHRWIFSFKIHYIMILIQWIFVLVILLPALITKDIIYLLFNSNSIDCCYLYKYLSSS